MNKSITFIPNDDLLLIKVDDIMFASKNGIIFPDQSAQRPQSGIVIKIGKIDGDQEIFEGDRVLFASNAGSDLPIDGTDYLLINSRYILGKDDKIY
jgi:chaperonin GroES